MTTDRVDRTTVGAKPDEPVIEVQTIVGPLLLPREDEVITPTLRREGMWEFGATRFLGSVLRPGDVFVDVGAHVGYFSLLAAGCVGEGGMVIAVEPEERNRRLLRMNLARNAASSVRVIPFAAYSRTCRMSLALDDRNRGGHRLVPAGEAGTPVRCVRLDDLLPATVDVVKIDTQGYDHEVLAGLERTLAANPALVVLAELSLSELGRRGIDPGVVLGSYTSLGLTISSLDDHGALRRTTDEQLLRECRCGALPSDFSLVLGRLPGSGTSPRGPDAGPTATAGLEIHAALDGVVVRDPARNRAHRLNRTAAAILALCTGEHTVAEIGELVREAFQLAEPPAVEVEQCLVHLRSEGLVV